MIGEGAFAGCSSLVRLMLYYSSGEDFTIDPGAFRVDEVVETAICYPSQNESVGLALAGYDWEAENRTASWYDVYGAMPLLYCYEGGSAHQGDYFNKVWVDSCRYNIYCKWCGQYLGYAYVSHSFVDGVCSKCGCEKPGWQQRGRRQHVLLPHLQPYMVYTPYSETQHELREDLQQLRRYAQHRQRSPCGRQPGQHL